MARVTNRLTTVKIASLKTKGFYHDGDGLYLRVTKSGTKAWIFRYRVQRKLRDMGLGPLSSIGLKQARTLAAACRLSRHEGHDPIETRKKAVAAKRVAAADTRTFRECAERLISAHEVRWRNPKHRQQWRNTLETYVHPLNRAGFSGGSKS
jgi:hypothetical protein